MEKKVYSARQKGLVYFLTILVAGGNLGLFGVISRIKKPMGDQLHLNEAFLGFADSMSFIGMVVAFAYIMIKPSKTLVWMSFIQSLGTVFFMELIALSIYLPWPQVFIPIGMFGSGFCRSFTLLQLSIVNHYFHETKCDKSMVQIWYSMQSLGNIAGIIVIDLMLNYLKLHWSLSTSIVMISLAIVTILLYILIPEIQMNSAEEQAQEQGKSICGQLTNNVINYQKKLSNFLHTMNFAAINSSYYLLLVWLTYYFQKIGYHYDAAWLSSLYPLVIVFGTMLLSPIFTLYFSDHYGKVGLSVYILNILTIVAISQLGHDKSFIPYYAITVTLIAFFTCEPLSRLASQDVRRRTSTDKQFFLATSQIRFSGRIFSAIGGLIAGVVMVIKQIYLFYVILALVSISMLIFIARWCLYPHQFRSEQETQDQALQPVKDQLQ